jgi:RNA polymerase sigma-70 factor (ECF subfamily)
MIRLRSVPRPPREESPTTSAPPAETRTPDRVLDELLVTLAQAHDAQALDRLARRWRPKHYTHARRLLRDPDAAAEAVQDAWVNVLRGIGSLEDPARFPA